MGANGVAFQARSRVVSSRSAHHEHTPRRHLAQEILTSKSALEDERKQITVLFADLKGSMELLADGDPSRRSGNSAAMSGSPDFQDRGGFRGTRVELPAVWTAESVRVLSGPLR